MCAVHHVSVRVPATSANLGPGFDCLGLALDLYLTVTARVLPAGLEIKATGVESANIATDESNRVYQAMRSVFVAAGFSVGGLGIEITNAIPLSRGLGSSAAAVAAGIVLANALASQPFDRHRLLDIGLPIEGHPDNLAPALFGGLTVSTLVEDRVLVLPVSLPREPAVVLFVPDFGMSTEEARSVLPQSVSRQDAVFNTGRASLLVAALAMGNWSVLRWAMEDRLHQPYRTRIFPQLPEMIAAALDAGAAGAAMSGAGSSVIAFCSGDPSSVLTGLQEAASRMGVPGHGLIAHVDGQGATLLTSEAVNAEQ